MNPIEMTAACVALAKVIGVPAETVTAHRQGHTTEIQVKAGGHTYYNAITERSLEAFGDGAYKSCAAALWGMLVEDGHLFAARCQDATEVRQVALALGAMRGAEGVRDIMKRPLGLEVDAKCRSYQCEGEPALSPAAERVVRDMMLGEALATLSMLLGQAVEAARGHRSHHQLHADLVQLAGCALALAAGVDPLQEDPRG